MTIDIQPNGTLVCLYNEILDLPALGTMQVSRASNVEWDSERAMWCVFSNATDQELFSHELRAVCLQWEHDHDALLLDT